jgi:hypothetical protein
MDLLVIKAPVPQQESFSVSPALNYPEGKT